MRLLTRLLLAGVCALTAWLLAGVVTVRALDDPSRLGLLPGRRELLIFFALFLALSGLVRNPGRAVAPVLLGTLATLPWWPLPVPAVTLLLGGPVGWAWFLGCLALIVRLPEGRWWWWRATRVLADPRRAPEIAAVALAALLALSAVHTSVRHPDGDEPDYLVIAQSLLHDGDLRIENNHQRFDYAEYHDGVLPPSYLTRGRDGHIYSVHAPGLPVLLVPAMALLGYPGAVATVILIAALGAALLWHLAHVLTDSAGSAWMAVAGTCGAATYALNGFVIFPDVPASVLLLIGIWALVEPTRLRRGSLMLVALALVWLPFMHTRYVVLAAGVGAAIVVHRAWSSRARDLHWFLVPAAVGAAAWFTFFWVIYGTPSPAGPYGAYTQTAWRQIPPGLLGLLVDQQYGLLAAAPVLLVAGAAMRRLYGRHAPDRAAGAATALLVMCAIAYVLLVASYRMWWGGLSAPARFLAPVMLPLGLAVAVGWQELRSHASRHVAVALLAVSLALSTAMVVVDNGRLAYDERDGRARWTTWASPIVDLAAALPAAHRDPPGIVARDASVWGVGLLLAWGALRGVERRGGLRRDVTMAVLGASAAACVAATWWVRTAEPWRPQASQVQWLEVDARTGASRRVAITPPVAPARWRADLDLLSQRRAQPNAYTLLDVENVPAGRYRVVSTSTAPEARFGVAVGLDRTMGFIEEMEADDDVASVRLVLPVPVSRLIVRGSREAADAGGRTWLRPERVEPAGAKRPAAVAARRFGDLTLFFPERGVFPAGEADGFWTGGETGTYVGVTGPPGRRVTLEATAGAVGVSLDLQVGPARARHRLDPGATTTIDVGRLPRTGAQVVDLQVTGGFRPAVASPGSLDQRLLGVRVGVATDSP